MKDNIRKRNMAISLVSAIKGWSYMALRQGWLLSGSCNLELARNKILTVSESWNEHLHGVTAAETYVS